MLKKSGITSSLRLIADKISEIDLYGNCWVDTYGVKYDKKKEKLLSALTLKEKTYRVESGTKVICDGAFASHLGFHCVTVQNVILPKSVTTIGKQAFESCPNLSSITLHDNVEYIGEYAICDGLSLESINIVVSRTKDKKEVIEL